MKSKFTFRDFYLPLLVFIFLGFSTLTQAQLTIQNTTSCTIYVQASQVDNASAPCTRCNVSDVTTIPPGGTWQHPGDASCGHHRWLGVRWYIHVDGHHGISYNPIWEGACGNSTRGDYCDESLTHATWDVPSSPGPATVTIQ